MELYEPNGGWSDFVSGHDDLEGAREATKTIDPEFKYWEIVDLEKLEVIERKQELGGR